MTFKFPLILATAGVALAAPAAIAGDTPPAAAQGQPYWAGVHWDDDDDDRHRHGAMPLPDADALKRAGMARVIEVERDDGHIEVEGYDADGRKLEIRMDLHGQRVLSVRRDD